MALEVFVRFEDRNWYPNNTCIADADVAGIGVVVSFTAAAILTTALSMCAAILDGVNADHNTMPLKAQRNWLRRIASGRLHNNGLFYRKVLDRLMLALADQQLLTGFAIIISGYFRATDRNTYNESIPYWNRLIESHFHLIVYLSCLSSSSHLACVITLKKYFEHHSATAWLRLGLIIAFALLLTVTICLAVPFGPTLLVLGHIYEYSDSDYSCSFSGKDCSDHELKFLSGLVLYYFVNVIAVLYPFWIAICQISDGTKGMVQGLVRRIWNCRTPWLPMHWTQKWFDRLEERGGRGRGSQFCSAIPRALKKTFWFFMFGNMTLAFYQQLLFVTISLAFVLAQKFAKSPDQEHCSLNTRDANKWGFGQILPMVLLGQFIFSGSGAYYELHDEKTSVLDKSDAAHESSPISNPDSGRYRLVDDDMPRLSTHIPSSRISVDSNSNMGDLSLQPTQAARQGNASAGHERAEQYSDTELTQLNPPARGEP